jgi:hypothetical protein
MKTAEKGWCEVQSDQNRLARKDHLPGHVVRGNSIARRWLKQMFSGPKLPPQSCKFSVQKQVAHTSAPRAERRCAWTGSYFSCWTGSSVAPPMRPRCHWKCIVGGAPPLFVARTRSFLEAKLQMRPNQPPEARGGRAKWDVVGKRTVKGSSNIHLRGGRRKGTRMDGSEQRKPLTLDRGDR